MFKLPLRRRKKLCGRHSLVDLADLGIILNTATNWALSDHGYAVATIGTRMLYLHRLLMGDIVEGKQVDHINGDKLDNRRENLRVCTARENQANTAKQARPTYSKFKGVCQSAGHWRAYIATSDKQTHLGSFATEGEAAYAYNLAAIERFGAFAKLNDVPEVPLNRLDNRQPGATGFKGVKARTNGTFIARAKVKGKEVHIGTFPTAEGASRARARYIGRTTLVPFTT